MPTLRFKAYRIIDRPDTASDEFQAVTVTMAVSAKFQLSFTATSSTVGVHQIAFNDYTTRPYGVSVDNVPLAESARHFVVYPTGSGGQSAFLVFARDRTETTGDKTDVEMIYIQIGGVAAPQFKTGQDFSDWFQARPLAGLPTSGALAPGQPFNLSKAPGYAGSSETDTFSLLPSWGASLVATGAKNDVVTGNDKANLINLGKGNDRAFGGEGGDTLQGEAGNDWLSGGVGYDALFGGKGKDTLLGGWGDDELTGGSGADHFVFDGTKGSDTITDFRHKSDVLDLQALDLTRDAVASRMQQVGVDVKVTLGTDSFVLVKNITVAALLGDLLL